MRLHRLMTITAAGLSAALVTGVAVAVVAPPDPADTVAAADDADKDADADGSDAGSDPVEGDTHVDDQSDAEADDDTDDTADGDAKDGDDTDDADDDADDADSDSDAEADHGEDADEAHDDEADHDEADHDRDAATVAPISTTDRPSDRPSDATDDARHGTFDVVVGDRHVGVVGLRYDGESLTVEGVRTEWRHEVEQESRREVRVWFHREGMTVVFKAEISHGELETATRVVDAPHFRQGEFDVVVGDHHVATVTLAVDDEGTLHVREVATRWHYEIEREDRHEIKVWFHREGVTVLWKAELSEGELETETRASRDGDRDGHGDHDRDDFDDEREETIED